MDIKGALQKQIEKLDGQKSDYQKMISTWINSVEKSSLSSKDKKKRILELSHLASFAMGLKNRDVITDVNEVGVVELSVEPDFVISYKGQRLGLEVRRVVNDKAQEMGGKRSFLTSVEKVFEKKHPGIKVLANISFNDSFDIRTHDNSIIKTVTADFIFSKISDGQIEMPCFIDRPRCVKHTHLSFNLSGAYIVGSLDDEIKQGIREKDEKVKNYHTKSDLEKVWLLLVVSGASPESDFSYFDESTFVCGNSFDSVFLLNDFKKTVYFLTKDWNRQT